MTMVRFVRDAPADKAFIGDVMLFDDAAAARLISSGRAVAVEEPAEEKPAKKSDDVHALAADLQKVADRKVAEAEKEAKPSKSEALQNFDDEDEDDEPSPFPAKRGPGRPRKGML